VVISHRFWKGGLERTRANQRIVRDTTQSKRAPKRSATSAPVPRKIPKGSITWRLRWPRRKITVIPTSDPLNTPTKIVTIVRRQAEIGAYAGIILTSPGPLLPHAAQLLPEKSNQPEPSRRPASAPIRLRISKPPAKSTGHTHVHQPKGYRQSMVFR